ncbi:hypothetical protein N7517_000532 [Penicillium concentricum]|uniref:dihydroneopterin aldolase n=1 Tax=Penicillium concentricum TaxID=293559 RepID=A0A9W9SQ63_9EURO|nr:uncharacterized protein N7517_000532 [Penicillium concentricum]KAJ5382621.1 hypothetical protein N7517_000532 [Penicillium concentricum]
MTSQSILPPRPDVLDSVRLRDIELPLLAPEAWHRQGKSQPCTATLKLSYSSIITAAETDNVSLTLDYGKLFRRLESDVRNMADNISSPSHPSNRLISLSGTRREEMQSRGLGQDPRVIAGVVADAGLGLLETTSAITAAKQPNPISAAYGECEVLLHLPKALLRADEGLRYRGVIALGEEVAAGEARGLVVLEEEFRIEGIRCYAILGVNPHERLEKQAVVVGLTFQGPGQLAWGSTVVDTYQAVTRAVAEKVDQTDFKSVESLATFIARIVTVDFGNESVTVKVEKPSALAFVQRSGVEITRTKAFFDSR